MKIGSEDYEEEVYWGKKDNGTPVKSQFRKKMEELITKGKDLVEAQRSKNEKQATIIAKEALAGVYCTLKELDTAWTELTQDQFNRLFGVRPIVMAAGLGTRYSSLIHKAVATGGTGRSNIDLAMEGTFGSPTTMPVILVNPKILGLVLKTEYLEGYNKETGSFEIKKDVLEQLEYQLIDSNSVYIDRDLLRRYFDRDNILLCYLPIPLGPGGDFLKIVKILCERGYETPYVEIAYGEMSTSVLPENCNASLVAYLKMLGGDYLAVVGAKESRGNLEFKGNFAFNKGKLAAHEDWERIPHGGYDEKEQKRFDRVLEQQGDNYRRARNILTDVQKQYEEGVLDDKELLKKVQELRDKYPYFVMSDEGELFCQEKLLEVRDKLRNWSEMSEREREYIKRNYAIVETRTETEEVTADLMISANVGIYRMSIIAGFYDELMKEFDEKGYKQYHATLKRAEPMNSREVGKFWGVDWKSGRSKAIVWSFARIIRDWWTGEHPGKEPPVAFVDVTGAPSSIKNPERQFEFTDRYREVYGVRKEAKIDTKPGILEKEIEKDIEKEKEIEKKLRDLLESNMDGYRKLVNDLFSITKNAEQQVKVFCALREIEENLEKKTVKGRKNLELISGIHLNAVVEAIDRDCFRPELIRMMDDRAVKRVIAYYFSPLYTHPGAGYIKAKLDRLFREAQDTEEIVQKLLNPMQPQRKEDRR